MNPSVKKLEKITPHYYMFDCVKTLYSNWVEYVFTEEVTMAYVRYLSMQGMSYPFSKGHHTQLAHSLTMAFRNVEVHVITYSTGSYLIVKVRVDSFEALTKKEYGSYSREKSLMDIFTTFFTEIGYLENFQEFLNDNTGEAVWQEKVTSERSSPEPMSKVPQLDVSFLTTR